MVRSHDHRCREPATRWRLSSGWYGKMGAVAGRGGTASYLDGSGVGWPVATHGVVAGVGGVGANVACTAADCTSTCQGAGCRAGVGGVESRVWSVATRSWRLTHSTCRGAGSASVAIDGGGATEAIGEPSQTTPTVVRVHAQRKATAPLRAVPPWVCGSDRRGVSVGSPVNRGNGGRRLWRRGAGSHGPRVRSPPLRRTHRESKAGAKRVRRRSRPFSLDPACVCARRVPPNSSQDAECVRL